jgi:hypothetical protein
VYDYWHMVVHVSWSVAVAVHVAIQALLAHRPLNMPAQRKVDG